MAIEQLETLQVVFEGNVVDAQCLPSGVPGLALVGAPVTTRWRLIHIASGRAVSRSAEHSDPEAVRMLARRIASLADWTDPNISLAVPHVREQLQKTLTTWISSHPDYQRSAATPSAAPAPAAPSAASASSDASAPTASALSPRKHDADKLVARLRVAEHERMLLTHVVRQLLEATTWDDFEHALTNLSGADQQLVRSLVSDGQVSSTEAEATAVVQSLQDARRDSSPTTRIPLRPRTPRVSGSDVAAS